MKVHFVLWQPPAMQLCQQQHCLNSWCVWPLICIPHFHGPDVLGFPNTSVLNHTKPGLSNVHTPLPDTASSFRARDLWGSCWGFKSLLKKQQQSENTENYTGDKLCKIILTANEEWEDVIPWKQQFKKSSHLVISRWNLSTPIPRWRQTECDLLIKITSTGWPTCEQARWRKNLVHFTPGKYQVNSDKPPAYHWKLTHATEGEGGWAPALSYGQSKQNLSAESLSLSPDFKQTLFLSDLVPEQLFSFYCSPRTAP